MPFQLSCGNGRHLLDKIKWSGKLTAPNRSNSQISASFFMLPLLNLDKCYPSSQYVFAVHNAVSELIKVTNKHAHSKHCQTSMIPAGIYSLKVNNRNNRTGCEICSKLTVKTPERQYWHRSGVFVNFKHISHLVLVFLLLTWNMQLLTGVKLFRCKKFNHRCLTLFQIRL